MIGNLIENCRQNAEHFVRVHPNQSDDTVGRAGDHIVLSVRDHAVDGFGVTQNSIGDVAKVAPRKDANRASLGAVEQLLSVLQEGEAQQLVLLRVGARPQAPRPQVEDG